MEQFNILVVDDEMDAANIVATRLKKFGYNVEVVFSGREALEHAKKKAPDLIIMDLLMPEMDGYEVSEKLNSDAATAQIPIIMLTVESSQKDKVRALKMGIDDYVTKPYDIEELNARIGAILRRSKTTMESANVGKNISLKDKKRIEFLRYLIQNGIARVEPDYNLRSKNGYYYKIAADFFGISDFSEINELKYLAEAYALKADFYDKILLCPFCYNYNINIRETSPSNHSANISLHDAFHHYRCGYIGTEDEFMEGIKYVCPKCFQELKNVGVDYDRPGKIYVANDTKEKFVEPHINCQCRNCMKFFEADDAVRQDIYAYETTDRTSETINRGSFTSIDLEQELVDQDVNVFNLRYFRNRLAEEMLRCKAFKRNLSIVLVSILNFDVLLDDNGETFLKKQLKQFASLMKQSLSAIDIPARYDKNEFIILLPEADKTKAESIISSLREKITGLMNVSFKMVSFPEDGANEEALLDRLIKKSSGKPE